jgi:hypothetical protein
MARLLLTKCKGIDTRPSWAEDDEFSLDLGTNLQVIPGGSIASRPARIKVCDLSGSSVGLYARGGKLRALVPSGQSLQATAPTEVIYDGIGQGGTFNYTGKIGRIVGVETYGTSQAYGPHGYVAFVRLDTGLVEHHWIKAPPASFASYVDTKVQLPFLPGRSMTKIGQHIIATDPVNGYIRGSSAINGPTDWTNPNDAFFEAALQHVSGSREITALGIHRGALAVFYSDAVQLWFIDVVPEANYLKETLNGPGTEFPGSVQNLYGDAFYLSRDVFSTLATATTSGQADYDDVGDRIRTLTASVLPGDPVVSVWSQKRGQYLVANGQTIYCFNFYPRAKEDTWTSWQMPENVEYIVENAGVVYYRSGNTVYRLDDTQGRDSGASSDISWSGLTRQMGFKNLQDRIKQLTRLIPQNTARCTYTPYVDGRVLTPARVTIPGGASPIGAHLTGSGRRIAIGFAGSGLMRIDGLTILAEACGI